MFARVASRLVQANKSAIVPKRDYNGILYQFSPPKNKISPGVIEFNKNLFMNTSFQFFVVVEIRNWLLSELPLSLEFFSHQCISLQTSRNTMVRLRPEETHKTRFKS
jgi:hypothetical protein